MRRLIIILLLYIFAVGCSSNQATQNEEFAVIAAVYNRVPKILPPPPNNSKTENQIEEEGDNSQLKSLIFNYAINENFVYYNFDYIDGISNRFKPYKSNELFKEEILSSSYMKLVAGLSELKKIEKIDKAKLDELLNDDLIFWNKQTITIQEKKENNISGIISFSKVSFNNDFTRAAVVVGDYFERIGSGVSLYILEKTDYKWVIKYHKTLEMS